MAPAGSREREKKKPSIDCRDFNVRTGFHAKYLFTIPSDLEITLYVFYHTLSSSLSRKDFFVLFFFFSIIAREIERNVCTERNERCDEKFLNAKPRGITMGIFISRFEVWTTGRYLIRFFIVTPRIPVRL